MERQQTRYGEEPVRRVAMAGNPGLRRENRVLVQGKNVNAEATLG